MGDLLSTLCKVPLSYSVRECNTVVTLSAVQLLISHMTSNRLMVQLFCHPKYSILYGALMIFVVGSGQE